MILMIFHTGSILSVFIHCKGYKGLRGRPEKACLRSSADVTALRHQEARCKQTTSFTSITVSAVVCLLVVDAD